MMNAIGLIASIGKFWLIDPGFATHAQQIAEGLDAKDVIQLQRAFAESTALAKSNSSSNNDNPNSDYYRVADGNAVIELIGTMTKRPTCMSEYFGGGASTLLIERAIKLAIADPDVKDISLMIETPGGEVSGAFDLADTIFRANKKKPIYAYLSDQATSGGYLVASQASRVFANSNALVGSIGVYTTLVDRSKALEGSGIKVHLVKAGEFKGVGVPGVPITADNIKTVQDRIDAFHSLFVQTVMRGRGMSSDEVKKVSDAQIFVGAQAIKVGLVDEIASFDSALKMARDGKGRVKTRSNKMDNPDNGASVDLGADVSIILDADIQVADVVETEVTPLISQPVVQTTQTVISADFWTALAAEFNISGDNVQNKIKTLIANGITYDTMIRDAATKMSVVAGLGDMKDFIASLPIENVLAHLKSSTTMARSKGLVSEGIRQTAAPETIIDPLKNAKPQDASTSAKAEDGSALQRTLDSMRNSGVYLGL